MGAQLELQLQPVSATCVLMNMYDSLNSLQGGDIREYIGGLQAL